MGKPITIVNKMAESVLTQEPQNASSLTQIFACSWPVLEIGSVPAQHSLGHYLRTSQFASRADTISH